MNDIILAAPTQWADNVFLNVLRTVHADKLQIFYYKKELFGYFNILIIQKVNLILLRNIKMTILA